MCPSRPQADRHAQKRGRIVGPHYAGTHRDIENAKHYQRGSIATITAVNYAGDEGGIMCHLEIPANANAVHVSTIHLRFDPSMPLAGEITAYQNTA